MFKSFRINGRGEERKPDGFGSSAGSNKKQRARVLWLKSVKRDSRSKAGRSRGTLNQIIGRVEVRVWNWKVKALGRLERRQTCKRSCRGGASAGSKIYGWSYEHCGDRERVERLRDSALEGTGRRAKKQRSRAKWRTLKGSCLQIWWNQRTRKFDSNGAHRCSERHSGSQWESSGSLRAAREQ